MIKTKKEVQKKDPIMKEIKNSRYKKYKTFRRKYNRDYSQLKIECFICHNVRYINTKYLEKLSNSTYSFLSKKSLYYIQKFTY